MKNPYPLSSQHWLAHMHSSLVRQIISCSRNFAEQGADTWHTLQPRGKHCGSISSRGQPNNNIKSTFDNVKKAFLESGILSTF